jgi:hypothetical protein
MASAEVMPPQLDRFASLLDPQWIDEALAATGTASIRHRRLPAEQVIWLVIGLALFRNDPLWPIVRQLGLDQRPQASARAQRGHWRPTAPGTGTVSLAV